MICLDADCAESLDTDTSFRLARTGRHKRHKEKLDADCAATKARRHEEKSGGEKYHGEFAVLNFLESKSVAVPIYSGIH